MTAYAFTGPSATDDFIRDAAVDTVQMLDRIAGEPTEIITGAAAGWDSFVALQAVHSWPDALHRVVLPNAPYDHTAYFEWYLHVTGREMKWAVETGDRRNLAYRARNERMVERARELGGVLVAGLRAPTFYRSGEWMTVNIARKRGVGVHVVDLVPPTKEGTDG